MSNNSPMDAVFLANNKYMSKVSLLPSDIVHKVALSNSGTVQDNNNVDNNLAQLVENEIIRLSKSEAKFSEALKKDANRYIFKQSTFNNKLYTSFSGADVQITISFQDGVPVTIGEAQTLTYSLYRPMTPVYNLGSAKAAGYVRGERVIAGSIIFTVFDRHVLLNAFYSAYANKEGKCLYSNFLSDELPPFDMHATFLNEYGQASHLVIHDVYVTSEGQVMSIEDMLTENTMQYVATDITLMKPLK